MEPAKKQENQHKRTRNRQPQHNIKSHTDSHPTSVCNTNGKELCSTCPVLPIIAELGGQHSTQIYAAGLSAVWALPHGLAAPNSSFMGFVHCCCMQPTWAQAQDTIPQRAHGMAWLSCPRDRQSINTACFTMQLNHIALQASTQRAQ